MTTIEIVDIIKNLGVPVGILAYILWRGDKFLTYFVGKLDKFNEELGQINISIQELTHTIKNGKS